MQKFPSMQPTAGACNAYLYLLIFPAFRQCPKNPLGCCRIIGDPGPDGVMDS